MEITGHTRFVGIFGYPVKHTLSPVMHNVAFAHLDLDYTYLPFEVTPQHLEQALRALPALQIAGVNLTIPHKEQAINFLDEVDEQAALIGAVNTVKVEGERLIGYNTDGQGFISALRKDAGVEPAGVKVCLLGAGGAARAIAVALAVQGVRKLSILNRTVGRAQALADHLKHNFPTLSVNACSYNEQDVIKESRIIVNTTSVGMKNEDELLIDPHFIQPGTFVNDIIYHPARTKLMIAAEERGASVVNGLGMLIHQGALAFEIWTGIKAPVDIMKHTCLSIISE